MTDVSCACTAYNRRSPTRDVRTFQQDYKEMVGAVEKPLRRVTASGDLETSHGEARRRKMREVRDRVAGAGYPSWRNTAAPSQRCSKAKRSAVNELKGLSGPK